MGSYCKNGIMYMALRFTVPYYCTITLLAPCIHGSCIPAPQASYHKSAKYSEYYKRLSPEWCWTESETRVN